MSLNIRPYRLEDLSDLEYEVHIGSPPMKIPMMIKSIEQQAGTCSAGFFLFS
ncbi:hypothetical protein D3C76_1566620 [compost metagenome]|uniref:hypothetical protein n=1 Tax=Paenibacillus sp. 7523-1 TaxID=2022550 RepID=UPI000F9FD97E|nr:hypothetical protein [Paenibacillus sp. 7523-1]